MRKIKSVCGNFSVYECDTKEELNNFIEENKSLFHFVGSSTKKTNEGKYRIVF